jgi:exonuclease III
VKLISWNVNGLRAVRSKGALAAIAAEGPDLLCLQEVRAREDQVGPVLPDLPYQFFATTRKPGYSGTAIASRFPAIAWTEGIGQRISDDEGRVVTVEYPSLYVVSVYVPGPGRTSRLLHDEGARYTWWSLATRARERNIGWRIDYVCISVAMRGRLRDAFILDSIMGSDHCPVGIVLEGAP